MARPLRPGPAWKTGHYFGTLRWRAARRTALSRGTPQDAAPQLPREGTVSMDYETIAYELSDHVATVTLNRPDRLNAFNQRMCDEFEHLWSAVRLDDDVRAVVLQAEGERAFSTGIDVREGRDEPENIWSRRDPGVQLGPKHNQVWKPVVAALHGMVAGG